MSRNQIISVKEARKILGDDAIGMADEDILNVITTLDLLAKAGIEEAKFRLHRKRDAKALANLIYDIYKEEKSTKPRRNKSV